MTSPTSPAPWRRRLVKYLVLLTAAVVLLPSLYTWFVLHWDYSAGYRSGLMQKFSRKGWICKTWEGELWQSALANVAPNVWYFTVRDPRVAAHLDTLVGKEVRLHYTEHRGVPASCFGDTSYYVDSVTTVTP